MNWVLGLRSRVPLLGFWVSGNRSHLRVGSRVSGAGSHQKSRVSGLTFRICRFDIIFTFLESILVIKLFRPFFEETLVSFNVFFFLHCIFFDNFYALFFIQGLITYFVSTLVSLHRRGLIIGS